MSLNIKNVNSEHRKDVTTMRQKIACPALFDRLTDNAAHKKKESEDAVLVTYGALCAAVLRDLAWL